MASLAEALESRDDPEIRHIVSLSGGKDSTALAIYLRQHYPELPAEYVFCDTGAELDETYEYLERLEALLGVEVVRLSALDLLGLTNKPNRSAFDVWLYEVYGGFLPNARSRWCTRVLKIKPFEDYVGEGQAFSYIGIRADENREGYVAKKPPVISKRPNILPVYPLKDDGLGLAEVEALLEESGLGLPTYYRWRSRSGCYFCFYQQIAEWQGLQENHPERFRAAQDYERVENGKRFTWQEGRTLAEIAALDRRQLLRPSEADGCAVCHL